MMAMLGTMLGTMLGAVIGPVLPALVTAMVMLSMSGVVHRFGHCLPSRRFGHIGCGQTYTPYRYHRNAY
ncbi:unnamed protein product [[Actinomadura] parvosata subsp. kistnae]|uniref:hypothetical protein n=1 Tax=[Actinomadura] parvosata TaxID=1955412 RepID=UPI000D2F0914|nr:unnamed protein product [Actinomadura parvosata subsp. kistnae]